jgi:hypothetical protein
MRGLADAHHFRKMVAGCCMVLAPLVLLGAEIVHPEEKTNAGDQLAVVANNLDQWYVAHLMAAIAVVLMVPAVLGLMHMLREREVAYGHVGGALAMLGLLALAGIVAMELVLWQMGTIGANAQMTDLANRLTDTTGIVVPFFVVAFGFMLGLICLAIGLYRARAVQSWMSLFLIVAAVGFGIEFSAASNVFGIVGASFLLVGLGSIGRMVLAETDEDWEHTPEYQGFRPVAGVR